MMMSRLHKKIWLKLPIRYYIIMIFGLLFGLYKNGLLLVMNGYSDKTVFIHLLLMPLSGFIMGLLYDKVGHQNNYYPSSLYLLLLAMIMPLNLNIFIYLGLSCLFLVFLFFTSRWSYNLIAFVKVLSLVLVGSQSISLYYNALETSGAFNYNFLDTLIGFQPSAIYTSSFILGIFALIFLLFDYYYKKEIALSSLVSYLLTLLILALVKGNILIFISNAFNSLIWFTLTLIGPLNSFSPVYRRTKIIYGGLIGILTVLFSSYLNYYDGAFLAIVFSDICRLILTFFAFLMSKQTKNKKIRLEKKEID